MWIVCLPKKNEQSKSVFYFISNLARPVERTIKIIIAQANEMLLPTSDHRLYKTAKTKLFSLFSKFLFDICWRVDLATCDNHRDAFQVVSWRNDFRVQIFNGPFLKSCEIKVLGHKLTHFFSEKPQLPLSGFFHDVIKINDVNNNIFKFSGLSGVRKLWTYCVVSTLLDFIINKSKCIDVEVRKAIKKFPFLRKKSFIHARQK
jgi:hypothetical protein